MKMASRSRDLISKKKNLHMQHTFFLISKKKICMFLPFFVVVLHDYNAILYD